MINQRNKLKDKNLEILQIEEDLKNFKNDEDYEFLFNDVVMNWESSCLIEDFLDI